MLCEYSMNLSIKLLCYRKNNLKLLPKLCPLIINLCNTAYKMILSWSKSCALLQLTEMRCKDVMAKVDIDGKAHAKLNLYFI